LRPVLRRRRVVRVRASAGRDRGSAGGGLLLARVSETRTGTVSVDPAPSTRSLDPAHDVVTKPLPFLAPEVRLAVPLTAALHRRPPARPLARRLQRHLQREPIGASAPRGESGRDDESTIQRKGNRVPAPRLDRKRNGDDRPAAGVALRALRVLSPHGILGGPM